MFLFLLVIILIRPFICSLAYPDLNYGYSLLFLAFFMLWIMRKGLRVEHLKQTAYPLWIFLLALALSTAFSQSSFNSIMASDQYFIGIACFIICSGLGTEEKRMLKRALILMGAAIGILALYQYFFGFSHTSAYVSRHNITSPFVMDYLQRKRVFFPFVTPNALAGYLSMLLLLAFSTRETRWSIVPLATAFCLTQSLGAFVSFLIALGIFFHLNGSIQKKHVRFFLSAVLIIILGFILTRLQTDKKHFTPVFSAVMRLDYWKDTWRIISAYPLTGIGTGNFDLPGSRFAHNSYLQLWAETGILGLGSFLWFIYTIIRLMVKNIQNSPFRAEKAGITAAASVFLIHNLFDFTFFLPEVNLVWWTILALIPLSS